MKAKERKLLSKSAELWNAYMELPELHEDDTRDFRFHIHAIQNIILSRSSYKKIKKEGK